jgi:periplasmic protein CpxP/Spy
VKKQIAYFALSTFLGFTAFAAPQEQTPAPATSQAQAATPAQPEGTRQFDPQRQVQMLTKKLNLTADQQQQLLPILTERNQQIQSIRNDNSLSRKDRHEKMLAVREESQNKIKAVLTKDQQQTYDQMLQQAREHHRDRKPQNTDNSAGSK